MAFTKTPKAFFSVVRPGKEPLNIPFTDDALWNDSIPGQVTVDVKLPKELFEFGPDADIRLLGVIQPLAE